MKKFAFILFLLACYFPLFLHLDSESLYHWDEARNGLTALEMIEHGNPLIRTYQGEPDHWETKPPLLIWAQIISMKIVGYNELGVRLPTALAALFTILLVFRFFVKEFDDFAGGLFAALTLLCTQGYVKFHVSRTGDHDALLIFFLTIVVLYFFKYLRSGLKNDRYLYFVAIGITLGVLTKSVMGFMMLPGMALFLIYKKYFLKIFTKKAFWYSSALIILSIGAYYFGRAAMDPGYLEAVWDKELFPRFFNTSKSLEFEKPVSKLHYLSLIINRQFTFFIYLLPFSLTFIFWLGEKRQKLFAGYILSCAIVFLVIISSGTVNSWYDAPIFPLLAILIGLGLSIFYKNTKQHIGFKKEWKQVLLITFFTIGLFSFPYYKIVQKVYLPDENYDYYGIFFKQIEKFDISKNIFAYYSWRNSGYLFYEKVYRDFKGWQIESCGYRGKMDKCDLQPRLDQQVLICNTGIQNAFEKKYDSEIIDRFKTCKLYQIRKLR